MSRFSDLYTEKTPEPEVLEGYNENAWDRDGDGIVQEGTSFERPAPIRLTKKRTR